MTNSDDNKKTVSPHPHGGHRQRMFQKHFGDIDMDNFAAHERLEMLLYHGTPLKDTNKIAHELIDTFGSLAGVLMAEPIELQKVKGVTSNSASLIAMILPLARHAEIEFAHKKNIFLSTFDDTVSFLSHYFLGRDKERILMVSMDVSERVIAADWISKGVGSMAVLNTRMAVEIACRRNAAKVILAHNHPAGNPRPSREDDILTAGLVSSMKGVFVELVDHVIVTPQETFSYRNSGKLNKILVRYNQMIEPQLVAESMTPHDPDGKLIDVDSFLGDDW